MYVGRPCEQQEALGETRSSLFGGWRGAFLFAICYLLGHVQQESTTTMQLPMTLRDNAATVHNESKLAAT